jgi:DtxR family Mn-dependent transcriptional regulator
VIVETGPAGVTILIPGHENVTLPFEMAHAVKVEKV